MLKNKTAKQVKNVRGSRFAILWRAVILVFVFALGAGSSGTYYFFKIREIKKYFPPTPEFASVIGEVISVSPEAIAIKIINIPDNPFEELPKERRVLVSENTPIVSLSNRSGPDFDKEMAEYARQQTFIQCSALGSFAPTVKISDKPLPAPSPYFEESLETSDIKPGDRILIDAGGGIKYKEEFSAVRIVVQP